MTSTPDTAPGGVLPVASAGTMPGGVGSESAGHRVRSWQLWLLAFFLMLLAAAYQRRTGPSYPARGELPGASGQATYELPRSHESSSGTLVEVPAVRAGGTLFWRRYPTDEHFAGIPLVRAGDELLATLPAQPPAGKLEYYLELAGAAGTLRVPAREAVVLRYHGPVPAGVLVPHILLMFLSMLVAVRAALGVVAGQHRPRIAWEALAGFTLGGLVLGPIVQRHAFGAYWTGVPWGWDLTDNKTLLMWAAWLLACLAPLWRERWRRPLVLVAGIVTIIVYVIPHSVHGSQLDWRATPSAPASQPRGRS